MSVLILGGNSSIAKCVARRFAGDGHDIYFGGRNKEAGERQAQDFKIRYGINTWWGYFDADDYASHKLFLDDVLEKLPSLDNVLLAFGYLGDNSKAANDFDEARKILEVNFLGAVSIATYLANLFEKRNCGNIIFISSVAGDRGRQSNYIYGSAKGGLSIFAQGLRNRLVKVGVNVITIKPGFVDTPMTYGMNLPKRLVASPDKVAEDIYKAVKKNKSIVYTPWFWKPLMLIIKSIPESIFKKLNL